MNKAAWRREKTKERHAHDVEIEAAADELELAKVTEREAAGKKQLKREKREKRKLEKAAKQEKAAAALARQHETAARAEAKKSRRRNSVSS